MIRRLMLLAYHDPAMFEAMGLSPELKEEILKRVKEIFPAPQPTIPDEPGTLFECRHESGKHCGHAHTTREKACACLQKRGAGWQVAKRDG